MLFFYDGSTRRLNQRWFWRSWEYNLQPLVYKARPLSATPPRLLFLIRYFCGRVPWLYQYWPGGFMLFVVLCPGTPEGSTGSGSGFKASQKTGQRLKVYFCFCPDPRIDTCFRKFIVLKINYGTYLICILRELIKSDSKLRFMS